MLAFKRVFAKKFQSTHPLRGATVAHPTYHQQNPISIHAPLAGCDFDTCFWIGRFWISIHAPLAGCDKQCALVTIGKEIFQSTHPLRGATVVSAAN